MPKTPIDISSVTIDDAGRLLVCPAEPSTFEFIYRAACGVGWDASTRNLVSPVPKEVSYFAWFAQIVGAVESEYGQVLTLVASTRWHNVPSDLREQVNEWVQKRSALAESMLANDNAERQALAWREEEDRVALRASEAASQAKDWKRVVRLLEPLEGRLAKAPAARLAFARKQHRLTRG